MAIAPIDLQTLFTQVDKVGKIQSSQREGQALQQAIQSIQIQKKTEEQILQVNEAQNMGEGAEKVNDQGQREQAKSKNKKKEGGQKDENKEGQPSVLRDLSLGRNIDISL
ncbi:MAG: hypothetical protein LBQ89_05735 [Treponema sp.]|jgi:hypothetical protein|nr:hypothetical protein [Treponema sp.]